MKFIIRNIQASTSKCPITLKFKCIDKTGWEAHLGWLLNRRLHRRWFLSMIILPYFSSVDRHVSNNRILHDIVNIKKSIWRIRWSFIRNMITRAEVYIMRENLLFWTFWISHSIHPQQFIPENQYKKFEQFNINEKSF